MVEEREVLVFGRTGVANVFRAEADLSDIGGDGGVGVSLTPEDEVLAGGVSKLVLVVVGESSERGEAEIGTGVILRVEDDVVSAFLSFSRMMSVSIFKSDSSSLSLCASMRSCSRSDSPALTSSSSIIPFSIV